jgi:hypothetical protein
LGEKLRIREDWDWWEADLAKKQKEKGKENRKRDKKKIFYLTCINGIYGTVQ